MCLNSYYSFLGLLIDLAKIRYFKNLKKTVIITESTDPAMTVYLKLSKKLVLYKMPFAVSIYLLSLAEYSKWFGWCH